ncbi:DUF1214 domain-containing protein [Mesorhizobium sp. NBSH29]|nr:DUF1214 domain-containing protein [Mesorhizobium sp. NBSH29]
MFFRTIFLIALVLAIAVGGGAASVWYALKAPEGFGALRAGPWTAFPDLGTPQAEPYSKARTARDGILTLGRAEGLSFTAQTDSAGAPLDLRCIYQITGDTPAARFWTLYAANAALTPLASGHQRPAALHSMQLLRQPDNSMVITAGRPAAPGNWLPVTGTGPFALVLTLYDTPAASSAETRETDLPRIERGFCADA